MNRDVVLIDYPSPDGLLKMGIIWESFHMTGFFATGVKIDDSSTLEVYSTTASSAIVCHALHPFRVI